MISPELYLLRAFIEDGEKYQKYRQLIKPELPEIRSLYQLLDSHKQTSTHSEGSSTFNITWPEFTLLAQTKLTQYDLEPILVNLDSICISESICSDVLNTLHERAISKEIALEALAVSEGRGSTDRIVELTNSLSDKSKVEELENEFVDDNLEVLHEGTVATPGLRWRLQSLNEMLGSLRRGDFGFLFARPESGKTTFLASEVTYFAGQTDRPILWFNNEEQGNKVALRCYQAALGCTTQELFRDIAASKRAYLDRTGGRIKIYDSASISKFDVIRLCKRFGPSLVLFDQIDKIKGFDGDRDDLRLGAIYQWAREIAKEYAPVLAVTQADGSGEGKKWLTMDNVSGAKTSKQAEADFIIGLGKSHDEGLEYIRHINISKNKLLGDADTKPELRHGKRDVIIDPNIARYRDI